MKTSIITFLFTLIISFSTIALAENAEGNLDGGGGGMGGGINSSFWSSGQEGVRVSIVQIADNKTVFDIIDLTNKKVDDIYKHFQKKSKLQYKNGSPRDRAKFCVKVNKRTSFQAKLRISSQRLKGSIFYGKHSKRTHAQLCEQPEIQ